MKKDVLKLYLKLRKSLLTEKARLEARLGVINETLGAADKIKTTKIKLTPKGRKRWTKSPEDRARISAAMKAKWAERKKAAKK